MPPSERASASPRPPLVLLALATLALLAGLAPAQDPRAPLGGLTPPANPDAIQGRWRIGGEEKTITAGRFHDLLALLTKLEGSVSRGVTPQQVWEHVLLVSEADAMGIAVTEAMVDAHLQRDDPDVWEGVKLRWRNQGVGEDEAVAYVRDRLRIDRMKDEVLNTQRVTTRQAFDRFKQNRQRYRLEYVQFAADDHLERVDMSDVDDLRLRTFYTDDRQVQAEYMRPATVTGEIVYLDAARSDVDPARAPAADREVTREEALDYFWKNREALMRDFPPAKRHLLDIKEGTPPEEVVTPFSVLEDSIRKRLIVEGVLEKARERAMREGADLKAVAAELGLGLRRVENLPRARSLSELREFGYNAFNAMNGAEIGTVSPIMREGDVNWFFHLEDRQVSELPPFAEVKDQLREKYREAEAYRHAREAGNAAMARMNDEVTAAIDPIRKRLEAEAEETAQKRAREQGLSNPQDIRREQMRAQAIARQQIERERQERMPRAYAAWVAEAKPEIRTTDWFEFDAGMDRMAGMEEAAAAPVDREEARRRFLESSYYIRSLGVGQVATVLLEDQTSRTFFIVKLLEKKDPDIATMGPLDRAQAIAELTQLQESRFLRRWRYSDLQQRFELVLMEVK